MTLTFLGSGTSQGVPIIGCGCRVCKSKDPRDKRFRSSVFIKDGKTRILVDTTPDLRSQALRAGLRKITAVVITHPHADHVMGFDDLRQFCQKLGHPLPIYSSRETIDFLSRVFPYAFQKKLRQAGYVQTDPHPVEESFEIDKLTFTPLEVPHGSVRTFGYLISKNGKKRCVYMPDCADVPDGVKEQMQDVPVLIIDGLRDKPHPTHLTVKKACKVSKEVNAGKTWLTHMAHFFKHEEKEKKLPKDIKLAYDELELKI